MLEKTLEKLGLSPSEIKTYLCLLNRGASYANKISSYTKINRTNVYEALDRLLSKGIISFITRNKVKWYEAKQPKYLVSLLQSQKDEIEATKKELLDDIGKLKILPQKNLEANIFVGKKGLRMLFEEMLELKKPIAVLGQDKTQFRIFFGPYFELWHRKRTKKGIRQRSIFPKNKEEGLSSFRKKLIALTGKDYIEYKFVDNKYLNPTATFMYGDNVILIEWSDEPLAIKIHHKGIAKSHLNYFNMLWES